MTDGAAKLLQRHTDKNPVFDEAYRRLTSRDPSYAWTSGQWMTERKGGSDVSGTETIATYDPESPLADIGPWSLSGFKWFSSATDANMSVLLAQTPKGLSLFYAPVRLPSAPGQDPSEAPLNGVFMQRLKNKLGSKALPTAELELKNMRAHLIGQEGHGIREVSTVLNITRIHNASGATSGWGRGIAVAKAYSQVRRIKGNTQLLLDTPAYAATLGAQIVDHRAYMLLTFLVVALLGREERPNSPSTSSSSSKPRAVLPSSSAQVSALLRLLTPVTKALTAKAAIAGLQECMESLGGLGYLENDDPGLNIARAFRDANVLSIWEGTTDIMADDVVRVVKGRGGKASLDALEAWLDSTLDGVGYDMDRLASEVGIAFQDWRKMVAALEADELRARGRACMKRLGWIVCAALLLGDASQPAAGGNGGHEADEEGDAVAVEVAKMWFAREGKQDFASAMDWRKEFAINRRLVAGPGGKGSGATKSRL